uniref:Uncharacterized protein n=1 Tax=Arundo donax TaxID=35708 RepID=A0A0A9B6M8_ARUDO
MEWFVPDAKIPKIIFFCKKQGHISGRVLTKQLNTSTIPHTNI